MSINAFWRRSFKSSQVRVLVEHVGVRVVSNDMLVIPGPYAHVIGAEHCADSVDHGPRGECKVRSVVQHAGGSEPVEHWHDERGPPASSEKSEDEDEGAGESAGQHDGPLFPRGLVRASGKEALGLGAQLGVEGSGGVVPVERRVKVGVAGLRTLEKEGRKNRRGARKRQRVIALKQLRAVASLSQTNRVHSARMTSNKRLGNCVPLKKTKIKKKEKKKKKKKKTKTNIASNIQSSCVFLHTLFRIVQSKLFPFSEVEETRRLAPVLYKEAEAAASAEPD